MTDYPVQRTVPAADAPRPNTKAQRSAFDVAGVLAELGDDCVAQCCPDTQAVIANVRKEIEIPVFVPRDDDEPAQKVEQAVEDQRRGGVESRHARDNGLGQVSPCEDGKTGRTMGKEVSSPFSPIKEAGVAPGPRHQLRIARWSDGSIQVQRGSEDIHYSADEWAQISSFAGQ